MHIAGRKFVTRLFGASALAAFPALASAQDAAPQAAAETSSAAEITVTAQKRSEKILDVPISITAVSGDQLAATGGQSLAALQGQVPGIYISSGGAYGASPIGIRGTTGTSTTFGDEPVAIYVDGVYRARAGFLGTSGLLDVGSIEIVRGPQGTLQGRNATAGAVLITSAAPKDEFGGFLKLRASDPFGYRAEAAITGPVSSTLKARFAAARTFDRGWAVNTFNGNHLDKVDDIQFRGSLLWQPDDRFELRLSGDYNYNKSNAAVARWAATTLNPNPAQALVLAPTPTTPLSEAEQRRIANGQFALNFDALTTARAHGGAANASYAFDGVDLISITALSEFQLTGGSDSDGFAVTDRQGYNFSFRNSRQFSQEVRLQSSGQGFFSWILGAYYFHEFQDQVFNIVNDGVTPTTATGTTPTRSRSQFTSALTTDSYAAFADVTLRPMEGFSVSGGVRYTEDKKKFDLDRRIFSTVTGNQLGTTFLFAPPRATWSDTSYRAKIAYEPTSNTLIYASYSTGFKAGGYNAFGADAAFEPETLKSAEIGFKAGLPMLRGFVSAAAFSNKYNNLQIRAGVPSGGVAIINAADSKIKGVEIEASLQPVSGLTLAGNVAYTDAKFSSFPLAQNLAGVLVDASGNHLPKAPEWQYFVSAKYEHDLSSNWTAAGELNYRYRSRIWHLHTDQGSTAWQGAPLREIGARLTFTKADSGLSFGLYGNNLNDDRSVTNQGNTFSYPLASFNRPRTIGAFAEIKF